LRCGEADEGEERRVSEECEAHFAEFQRAGPGWVRFLSWLRRTRLDFDVEYGICSRRLEDLYHWEKTGHGDRRQFDIFSGLSIRRLRVQSGSVVVVSDWRFCDWNSNVRVRSCPG
jgi:hypothetical protein